MKIWRSLEVSQGLTAAGQGFLSLCCREASGTSWLVQIHRDKQPWKLSSPFSLGNHLKGNKSAFQSQRWSDQLMFRVCHTCRTSLCPLPPTPIPMPTFLGSPSAQSCLCEQWRKKNSLPQFPWRWEQAGSVHLLLGGIWPLSVEAEQCVNANQNVNLPNVNQTISLPIRVCV